MGLSRLPREDSRNGSLRNGQSWSMPSLSKEGPSSWSRPSPRRLSSISGHITDSLPSVEETRYPKGRTSWVLMGRFEDTSHFIAQSKWGISFEKLITPITLDSIESWALYMFVLALVMTVPFGAHRIMYGWWEHIFFSLQVANFILELVGLNPLFGGDVLYNRYPTEEQSPGTDRAFAFHILAGLLWLTSGFLLFFTVNKISERSHRRLAYASGLFLFLHMAAAAHVLYVNTVKHPNLTRMMRCQELFAVSALVIAGTLAAKRKDIMRHQDIMARAFILSVEGAGTIRVASLFINTIARFFTPEAASHFEIGACYAKSSTSAMGINAHDCQVPYMIRLMSMRLVSCYHQALYLKMPEKARDKVSRMHLREEIQSCLQWIAVGCAIGMTSYHLDQDLSVWNKYLNMVPAVIQLFVTVGVALKCAYDRYKHSHHLLLMPRRNAIIPGRTSTLVAARNASQFGDFSDSESDSDKEKDE